MGEVTITQTSPVHNHFCYLEGRLQTGRAASKKKCEEQYAYTRQIHPKCNFGQILKVPLSLRRLEEG